MVRYRVVTAGRVQGVWFRETCRSEAVAAGVMGWVRNNRDGTVEAVLEGDVSAVEAVLAWMKVGPPRALVTNVEVRTEDPADESSFVVR